jgi:predicted  nucleic acid-binding Zn-ribbon protein
VTVCALQKYASLEEQWSEFTADWEREKAEATQAVASMKQELSAAKDELQQAQSNIGHLTESLKGWQQKASDANQQVSHGLGNTARDTAAQHSFDTLADCALANAM